MIAENLVTRSCFAGYSYRHDMISTAIFAMYSATMKFDIEKYDRPFPYFNKIAYFAILRVLKNEKKMQHIRDALLVDGGLDPSFAFSEEHQTDVYEKGRIVKKDDSGGEWYYS